MLANGTGKALVKQGGDSWFFLTADYAFGYALERDTAAVVQKEGGKVAGSVRVPLNTQDFSSFLLQAQASKAKVIGLANAGGDTTNSIKGAAEFGITKAGQKLAGLLVDINDVHALGLPVAQGLTFTDGWYWDTNDDTRKFAERFSKLNNGKYPGKIHAGVYSSVYHYLKAVYAINAKADGATVVKKMKEMPTEDSVMGKGTVRVDGRHTHPVFLVEVKKPEESKKPWDYYKILTTIPADEAFRPLKDGGCSLVN
jgi:branched-chain amino acid transport system substrate-binding protein